MGAKNEVVPMQPQAARPDDRLPVGRAEILTPGAVVKCEGYLGLCNRGHRVLARSRTVEAVVGIEIVASCRCERVRLPAEFAHLGSKKRIDCGSRLRASSSMERCESIDGGDRLQRLRDGH